MRVSMPLVTLAAAALSGSAAGAASVTVNFPATGDFWCATYDGGGTCGALSSFSGKMQDADDFVASAEPYPYLDDLVATGVSGTLNLSGASAYTVLDFVFTPSDQYQQYQIILYDAVGPELVPFSFAFSTPIPLDINSTFRVILDQNIPQTNPIDGNWIQIGTGTMTFTVSVPETSTWAMIVLGFAGLGFASYRVSRTSVAVGAA
jgi:hypothetical protein